MLLRLSPLACLFVVFPIACGSSVVAEDDAQDAGAGGSGGAPDECPPPPPASGGFCPPIYDCIDGEWIETAGGCPDPCPDSLPPHGGACDAAGASCSYDLELDCGPSESVTATCTEDGWVVTTPYCLPEPECPDELPLDGENCEGWDYAYGCSYDVEASCGPVIATAFCEYVDDQMIWTAQLADECPTCDELTTPETCGAHSGCAWQADPELCEPIAE